MASSLCHSLVCKLFIAASHSSSGALLLVSSLKVNAIMGV
jgi:hypothetical protein